MEQRISETARLQSALADISGHALDNADLTALMATITDLIAKSLNVEFCKVLELLPGKDGFLLRAGVGWNEGLVGQATVPAGTGSQAGFSLLHDEPVITEDHRTEKRFSPSSLLRDHGILSGISVRIGRSNQPFGTLGAHSSVARSFSSDDVQFLQIAANVLSQVIENKRALEEIGRKAIWIERLIQATQDAVISIDRHGCVLMFNASAERMFGYTTDEVVGQKVNVLMAQPYATEHDAYIARYEETGEARAIGRTRVVEGRRKNGEVFPLELSVTQVGTDKDEVHYAAFIRDISEVRRGQAWLNGLIQTTQDAVLSIDRQGRIVLFNPAAERIFGYTREEIAGQKVNMLMAEPYATEHDDYIGHYEKTGEARAIGRIRTVTARRKTGELFPIELSVAKIEEDRNVQYGAFIRDVSEKSQLQARLVENERLVAIGATAARIGHELGNPLNGMALTIQLLENRLKKSSDLDGHVTSTVNRLKNEVSRLNTLLGQFRSLSRREKFDFQRTNLNALISETIEIEIPRYAQLGIHVVCSFPSDLPTIKADIDKLKQVILNLTKNAAEAMAGGGRISIEATASENGVVLEISDTGTGIPAGANIFEPFFTTKPEGTGIGLSIVQQIINAHGGSITYKSEPGNGTTFTIVLPLR